MDKYDVNVFADQPDEVSDDDDDTQVIWTENRHFNDGTPIMNGNFPDEWHPQLRHVLRNQTNIVDNVSNGLDMNHKNDNNSYYSIFVMSIASDAM